MTGFGASSGSIGSMACTVEIRSVNHRFAEVRLRVPSRFEQPGLEQRIVKKVKEKIKRGSVQIAVHLQESALVPNIQINKPLALSYGQAFRDLAKEMHQDLERPGGSTSTVLIWVAGQPGVLFDAGNHADATAWEDSLFVLVKEALDGLTQSRAQEGLGLQKDLLQRVSLLRQSAKDIQTSLASHFGQHQHRLQERLVALLQNHPLLETPQLAQEVAALAHAWDPSEELARIHLFLEEFERTCNQKGTVGRAQEFILQELQREINTLGSKSQSAEITLRVIAMKTELERMREQIQNVE